MYIYFTPTNGVNLMKGNSMSELDIWQQGHSAGLNLAVKMVNEWCGFECKTLAELIQAINQIKEEVEA